ncbi:tRNA1(Val) (adenine(37)-N6)-methyltransferase [Pasteurellaceae bacterium 22721_9_1]
MSGFRFKQFHIQHDRCAMKVGTDGILLGAYADICQAQRILDLGTGTGLVALMLAQRSNATIYAIELDNAAYLQAQENIQHSPWQQQIQLIQQDALEFCQKCGEKFDLIVANPPYFAPGIDCKTEARNQARYMQQSHLAWLESAAQCLAPNGKIQFILPFDCAETLIKQTALYCVERLEIMTKSGKAPQRMIVSFQSQPKPTITKSLTIYNEQNQYSQDFVALTKDFYLKM